MDLATSLVSRGSVEAIARTFRPDALVTATNAKGQRPVSRATVYRALDDRAGAVVDLARHLGEPIARDLERDLRAAEKALATVADADAGDDVDLRQLTAQFRDIVHTSVQQHYVSVSSPAGWVLQAAALTSSPLWRGARPTNAQFEAAGRQILAVRGEHYEHATAGWAPVLRDAMAAFGRRPREGHTVETIVKLTHCLCDGYVLRTFTDPTLNDPTISSNHRRQLFNAAIEAAADAMFDLIWANTEPAGLEDTRRPPAASDAGTAFEQIVATAAATYAGDEDPTEGDGQPVAPVDAAEGAGLPGTVGDVLFGGAGDLADSVLRHLVAPGGFRLDMAFTATPAPVIRSVLARLSTTATTHPRLIAAARTHPPSSPPSAFLGELTRSLAHALRAPKASRGQPDETAEVLVYLALAGESGWSGVEALLQLVSGDDHQDR